MVSLFPVTVHVIFRRDDKVLLIRRFNTGYEDRKYSVPSGHVERGESIRQAAAREAKEEIGIELEPTHVRFAGVMHRKSDDERVDFFVEATQWQGEPANLEPHKCDELLWPPMGSLPSNLIPYVMSALQDRQHAGWFEEFGWNGDDIPAP